MTAIQDRPTCPCPPSHLHGGENFPAECEIHGQARDIKDADHAAGMAFKEGRYLDAARMLVEAKQEFPEQAELWARRSDAVMARMHAANQIDRNDDRPLDEIVEERLIRAGVQPGDPELTDLRNWNLDQLARDPNISNTPEPATDREAEA
jgi:hypothetical protein